jgi:hypothetical protein
MSFPVIQPAINPTMIHHSMNIGKSFPIRKLRGHDAALRVSDGLREKTSNALKYQFPLRYPLLFF